MRPLRGLPMLALLAAALLPAAAATGPDDWTGVAPTPVLEGLKFPVDIDVAPDGTVWFIELAGNVSRAEGGAKKVVHVVPNVIVGQERGLVGFALAHDFEDTGAYYLYYTERTDDPDGGLNQLVRMQDGNERRLLSVPGAKEHNGGRIVVDTDGNLFVGTGENQLRDPAQDLESLLGKVLHVTPTGEAAPGNHRGLVYSYGHRNPYGLALNRETGELWETENSGWRRDEINIVQKGGNYGYPECEGHGLNGVDTPCPTTKGYVFPVLTFYEKDAVAPTGAAFWKGGFYWASLNEGSIHHIWKDAEGQWQDAKVFENGYPILDLAVGPDGDLFFSDIKGIYRIEGGEVSEADPSATSRPPPGGATSGPDLSGETSETAASSALGAGALVALALAASRRRR